MSNGIKRAFKEGKYDFPGTRSKPEIEFEQKLKDANIIYQHSKFIYDEDTIKCYDFYLPEKNLLIEIDGEYWHAKDYHDGLKSFDELYQMQQRCIINDENKNNLAKKLGYKLIRLWVNDINKININEL